MTRTSPVVPLRLTQEREVTARRPAPLAPAAIGLVVGIAIDNAWALSLGFYLALALLASAGVILGRIPGRFPWLMGLVAAVGLGGVLHDNFYRRVRRTTWYAMSPMSRPSPA